MEFVQANRHRMLDLIGRRVVMIKEVCWAKNVESAFNEMWCSQDYKQVTSLFGIVKNTGVRDKVVEEEEAIIRGVNISVFGGIKGVKRGVINGVGKSTIGATKSLIKWELLFL